MRTVVDLKASYGLAFLAIGLSLLSAVAKEMLVDSVAALDAAVKAAQPGDVIIMTDGEWKDASITLRGQGMESQPITLRAQTLGQVVMSGKSSLHIAGEYLVVDGLSFKNGYVDGNVIEFRGKEGSRHCRLTNTSIVDYNAPGTDAKKSVWISLYGKENRVDHCYVKGKTTESPELVVWLGGDSGTHLIDHNHFAGRPPLGKNGGEIMRIGDSNTSMQINRTVVEFNYFENCDGEVEIVSNKSCDNIYRHNTFVRNAGSLVLRHGNRCVVEGNYFFGENKPNSGGIRVFGEGHRIINNYLCDLNGRDYYAALPLMAGQESGPLSGSLQVKQLTVAFNTLVNCKENLIIGYGLGRRGSLAPEGCEFTLNVVVSPSRPLITSLIPLQNSTWNGNLFWGAELGLSATPGIQEVDPKLEKNSLGLWRPTSGDSVTQAVLADLSNITEDILGRPRGEKKNVGCLQESEAPVKYPPLTPKDVGPSWMTSVVTN